MGNLSGGPYNPSIIDKDGQIILLRQFRSSMGRFRIKIAAVILSFAFVCGPVFSLTWYFDMIDGLSGRIAMTVLVSIFPVAIAFTNYKGAGIPWREWAPTCWLVALLILANGLALSDKNDWFKAGVQFSLLIIALLGLWIIWQFIGRNWLIWACLALASVLFLTYWVAALIKFEDSWQLILLPLLFVLVVGAVWAPCAAWVVSKAKKFKNRRIRGPGLQAFVMMFLFLPVIFIAIAVPWILQLGQQWSAVSLLIAGIILSVLVAEPLRRFLLEWGDLYVNRP